MSVLSHVQRPAELRQAVSSSKAKAAPARLPSFPTLSSASAPAAAPHRPWQQPSRSHVCFSSTTSPLSIAPPELEPTATNEAPGATAAPSAITFNIHYPTAFGEVVKMVGSGPELGDWDIEQAVTLTWTQGDVWTATLQLSPELVHEFKFVLYNTISAAKNWEDGPNRRLDTKDCCPTVDLVWSSLAATAPAGTATGLEPSMTKEEQEAKEREREEASQLIFQAFSRMTSQAQPGSVWAPVEQHAAEVEAESAAADDEFSALVADLEVAEAAVSEAQAAEVRK